jgi:hypothetical protein
MSDSRESIIEDLRDFGVKVNQILVLNPTDQQLKDMRDGLMRLYAASKTVSKYRLSETTVVPVYKSQ